MTPCKETFEWNALTTPDGKMFQGEANLIFIKGMQFAWIIYRRRSEVSVTVQRARRNKRASGKMLSPRR